MTAARRARAWRLAAVATILAWCVVELVARRAAVITDDWHGWRQADTQAIARSFAFEDFAPWSPRIDWRGDGPGHVETEAQLYPALIAVALRVVGDSVWPGQLLSLACVALAAAILFAALARRFGEPAAYVALLAVLSTKGVVVIATSIQPDPLALLAFTLGFVAFCDYLDDPRPRRLLVWVAATAVAGLVKPTTLELGLAQFLLCAARRRDLLRTPWPWLGWAAVLAVVGAYLLHARALYVAYGNTFGVLSGGDSKLPTAAALASPGRWLDLLRFAIVWGVGFPGALAAGYLAARRRVSAEALALAAAALASLVVAFRYTSGTFGTHYHLPHVVLGGWLVAHAASLVLARPRALRPLVAATAAAAVVLTALAVRAMRALPPEPETALGRALAAHAAPGTLVVVRARAPGVDPEWGTVNNFQDPRVFYVSRTYGWVLPNDAPGAAPLAALAARGARYYVHVAPLSLDADLAAWLATHADVVAALPEGAVYRLRGD